MILEQLSSTIPTFRTIKFNDSFNVIVGNPLNKEDGRSHNLGKTTILKLVKFVLFDGSKTFLTKVQEKYPDAQFTINYILDNKKISFSRDFSRRKAGEPKEVETIIDYEYFIRLQDEFDVVNAFKKPSFQGKDLYWKPRLIGLLGFDQTLLQHKLKLSDEIKNLETAIKTIKEANVSQEKNEKDILSLQNQKNVIVQSIKELKFFSSDDTELNILVDEIDKRIAEIRPRIYTLRTEKRKVLQSLQRLPELDFDTSKIEKIFNQINLYFETQVKKDVETLNDFYKYMYSSRKIVLEKHKQSIENELNELEKEANELDERRSSILSQLSSVNAMNIYEEKHSELIEIETKIALLGQNSIKQNVKNLEDELSKKQTAHMQAATDVSKNIDEAREKFEKINAIYAGIMQRVLKIDAEIRITKNNTGNLDIATQSYKNGIETDELKGDTAKKISAAAIDIAIRCIQNDDKGFIAQDSVIDSIDKNGAREFVAVVKELAKKYNFQYIMTALKENLTDNITEDDVIIELNDASQDGLLMGFSY